MDDSIIPLLAERLDVSESRARSLLNGMLEELRHHAAADGVHLSGLGTFEKEDGTLTFVPSAALRRHVNQQFEGLSPEVLGGDEPDEVEAELPPSLRDVSGETATSALVARAVPSGVERPVEDLPSSLDHRSIQAIEPVEAEEEADEPESRPSDASADAFDWTTEEPPSSDRSGDEAEPAPEADPGPADEPRDAPSTDDATEEPETASPIGGGRMPGAVPLLGGLVLILLLAGAGWFLFSQTSLRSSGPEATPSGASGTESTQASANRTATDTTGEGRSDQPSQRSAGATSTNADSVRSASASEAVRWTIVVASRASRAAAQEVAEEYERRAQSEDDGVGTVEVVSGTVNGQTWYRVTIGRYDAEAAAQQALKTHDRLFPAEAWILRLQE